AAGGAPARGVLPGPGRGPARLPEPADSLLRIGADLQVVVDGRELPVEREAEALVALELVEHFVDDVDERHPERLERAVPLPVPVCVRDEEDAQIRSSQSRQATPARNSAAA